MTRTMVQKSVCKEQVGNEGGGERTRCVCKACKDTVRRTAMRTGVRKEKNCD
jgi:hypothetical protein